MLIGALSLAVGLWLYLAGRGAGAAYLKNFLPGSTAAAGYRELLGPLRDPLPEFIHPFAFSLITAGLFSRSTASRFGVCLLFAVMNIVFELGQKYKAAAIAVTPAWFDHVPLLENTRAFFRAGTFDPWDIAGAAVGSAAAFGLSQWLAVRRNRPRGPAADG